MGTENTVKDEIISELLESIITKITEKKNKNYR
jgi:hypothetical protein